MFWNVSQTNLRACSLLGGGGGRGLLIVLYQISNYLILFLLIISSERKYSGNFSVSMFPSFTNNLLLTSLCPLGVGPIVIDEYITWPITSTVFVATYSNMASTVINVPLTFVKIEKTCSLKNNNILCIYIQASHAINLNNLNLVVSETIIFYIYIQASNAIILNSFSFSIFKHFESSHFTRALIHCKYWMTFLFFAWSLIL